MTATMPQNTPSSAASTPYSVAALLSLPNDYWMGNDVVTKSPSRKFAARQSPVHTYSFLQCANGMNGQVKDALSRQACA